MTALRRVLGPKEGIALALGSIAGSGILFLPSLTYAIGGRDVLLIWAGGTLLCVPLLFLFADIVHHLPDGSGLDGFVARGLGPHAAASVPVLFLALVAIGLPGALLVAGEYLKNALDGGLPVQTAGALGLIGIAVAVNLAGWRTSAGLQNTVLWLLLATALLLCLLTYPYARGRYGGVLWPTLEAPGTLLSGIVVAFWAYAGFENLTFLAGEFKNPRRDFFLAMSVAFVVYGGLAVALTANLAALIPRGEVNQVAGLYQLAGHLQPALLSTWVITVFALALMLVNANSWVWGMSRLIYASARSGRLPAYFGTLAGDGVPRRAVVALGVLCVLALGLFAVFPTVLVEALIVASSVFMFVNVLCLASYLASERRSWQTWAAAGLLVFLLLALAGAGARVLYPAVVFAAAFMASVARARRAGRTREV